MEWKSNLWTYETYCFLSWLLWVATDINWDRKMLFIEIAFRIKAMLSFITCSQAFHSNFINFDPSISLTSWLMREASRTGRVFEGTLIDVCHLNVVFSWFWSFDFSISSFCVVCHRMKNIHVLFSFCWLIFLGSDLLSKQIFCDINGFSMIDSYITRIWFVTSEKRKNSIAREKTTESFDVANPQSRKIMMEIQLPLPNRRWAK